MEFQRPAIGFYIDVETLLVGHDVFEVEEVFAVEDHLFQTTWLKMKIDLELTGKFCSIFRWAERVPEMDGLDVVPEELDLRIMSRIQK